jgi:hypothetical protein
MLAASSFQAPPTWTSVQLPWNVLVTVPAPLASVETTVTATVAEPADSETMLTDGNWTDRVVEKPLTQAS